MSHQILRNLDLYPEIEKEKLKTIDAMYKVKVKYWATRNYLQDYKIYVTMMCMFNPKFFNILQQVPRDNLWPTHLTNWNYKT